MGCQTWIDARPGGWTWESVAAFHQHHDVLQGPCLSCTSCSVYSCASMTCSFVVCICLALTTQFMTA
jgi:hypothetical protein